MILKKHLPGSEGENSGPSNVLLTDLTNNEAIRLTQSFSSSNRKPVLLLAHCGHKLRDHRPLSPSMVSQEGFSERLVVHQVIVRMRPL